METINTLYKLNEEIKEIEQLLKNKCIERYIWCKENRNQLKKLMPLKTLTYQIIDITKIKYYASTSYKYQEEQVFYFKPTNTTFYLEKDFGDYMGYDIDSMVTVIGDILDCNLKKISDAIVPIDNIKQIEKENNPELYVSKRTNIYIMIDKNTGYYKIGRSINPLYRERTLQSEKPTIQLLHSFDAFIKDEKELHNLFNDKKVRGEWYDLSGSDIDKIKIYFNQNIY